MTVERVNAIMAHAGIDRELRSGWRPASYNAGVPGAAPKSTHITGEAVDIEDDDGRLRGWLSANPGALAAFDLYTEDPRTTPTWCHLQTRAPASGKRVYIPSAMWAARLAKEGSKIG